MHRKLISILILIFIHVCTFAQTEKRIALIVGNSEYVYEDEVKNATNDTEALSLKLHELGFDVILKRNLNAQDFDNAILEFANKAYGYDVALFYYAGHGAQEDGRNYLIPIDVDTDVKTKEEQEYNKLKHKNCIDANIVLEKLYGCDTKIMILDACRTIKRYKQYRGDGAKGLAEMKVPTASSGTFIAYSTSPGCIAYDGGTEQEHSPYAAALLKALDKSGLTIFDVFQEVTEQVVRETLEEQTPWISSAIRGRFIFNEERTQSSMIDSNSSKVSTATSTFNSINWNDKNGKFTKAFINKVSPINTKSIQLFNNGAIICTTDDDWIIVDDKANVIPIQNVTDVFVKDSKGVFWVISISQKHKETSYMVLTLDKTKLISTMIQSPDGLEPPSDYIISPKDNGLYFIRHRKTDKRGYINSDGEIIIPCIYDRLSIADYEHRLLSARKGKEYYYIDNNDRIMISEIYPLKGEESLRDFFYGYTWVRKKDGKGGMRTCCIDLSGKEVINNGNLTLVENFNKSGLAYFSDKKNYSYYKWMESSGLFYLGKSVSCANTGIINIYGQHIVRPGEYEYIYSFDDGYIIVVKNGLYGCIDKSGTVIIPCRYQGICDEGKYGRTLFVDTNNLAKVKKNDKYGYIHSSGELIVQCKYDDAGMYAEGFAFVKKNGLYGYIDILGKEVTPFIYNDATSFCNGVAVVNKNNKWGAINVDGDVVIPFEYESISSFNEEGIAVAKAPNGYYNYVNKEGKVLIKYKLTHAENFDNGFARIELEGKKGLLDLYGNSTLDNVNHSYLETIDAPIKTDAPLRLL